jgi:CBS domain-containing protein
MNNEKLVGLITTRDLRLPHKDEEMAGKIMNPIKNLHCIRVDKLSDIPSPKEIKAMMAEKRVEKIPIVNNFNEILGKY